jgi:hypothetical protein
MSRQSSGQSAPYPRTLRDLNHSGRKRSETIAKCTVEPPTALPLLLLPSCNGLSPSTMRSSVQ